MVGAVGPGAVAAADADQEVEVADADPEVAAHGTGAAPPLAESVALAATIATLTA